MSFQEQSQERQTRDFEDSSDEFLSGGSSDIDENEQTTTLLDDEMIQNQDIISQQFFNRKNLLDLLSDPNPILKPQHKSIYAIHNAVNQQLEPLPEFYEELREKEENFGDEIDSDFLDFAQCLENLQENFAVNDTLNAEDTSKPMQSLFRVHYDDPSCRLVYKRYYDLFPSKYYASYICDLKSALKPSTAEDLNFKKLNSNLQAQQEKRVTLAPGDLQFDSKFESGNLFQAWRKGANSNEYNLILQNDINTKGNTQWFFYSTQGARKEQAVTFNIINMNKKSSLFQLGMLPCVYSLKRKELKGIGWKREGYAVKYYKSHLIKEGANNKSYYTLSFTYTFQYNDDKVYFAYGYPYTYSHLNRFLKTLEDDQTKAQYMHRRVLCKTLARNNIDVITITAASSSKRETRKLVYFIGRQHPGEVTSSYMIEGAIKFLTEDSPEAEMLRHHFVFKIIPMVNVDGVIHGNNRCSLAGVDLNRHWKNTQKKLHPCIWHIQNMIKKNSVTRETKLLVDFHGHSKKLNAFFYGNSYCAQPELTRIFPLLVSKQEKRVSFESSRFKVQKYYESTARIALWRALRIPHVFTLEASFYGYYDQANNNRHKNFTPKSYIQIGRSVCMGLFQMLLDETKLNPDIMIPQLNDDAIVGIKKQVELMQTTQSVTKNEESTLLSTVICDLQEKRLIDMGESNNSGSDSSCSEDDLDVEMLAKILPKDNSNVKKLKVKKNKKLLQQLNTTVNGGKFNNRRSHRMTIEESSLQQLGDDQSQKMQKIKDKRESKTADGRRYNNKNNGNLKSDKIIDEEVDYTEKNGLFVEDKSTQTNSYNNQTYINNNNQSSNINNNNNAFNFLKNTNNHNNTSYDTNSHSNLLNNPMILPPRPYFIRHSNTYSQVVNNNNNNSNSSSYSQCLYESLNSSRIQHDLDNTTSIPQSSTFNTIFRTSNEPRSASVGWRNFIVKGQKVKEDKNQGNNGIKHCEVFRSILNNCREAQTQTDMNCSNDNQSIKGNVIAVRSRKSSEEQRDQNNSNTQNSQFNHFSRKRQISASGPATLNQILGYQPDTLQSNLNESNNNSYQIKLRNSSNHNGNNYWKKDIQQQQQHSTGNQSICQYNSNSNYMVGLISSQSSPKATSVEAAMNTASIPFNVLKQEFQRAQNNNINNSQKPPKINVNNCNNNSRTTNNNSLSGRRTHHFQQQLQQQQNAQLLLNVDDDTKKESNEQLGQQSSLGRTIAQWQSYASDENINIINSAAGDQYKDIRVQIKSQGQSRQQQQLHQKTQKQQKRWIKDGNNSSINNSDTENNYINHNNNNSYDANINNIYIPSSYTNSFQKVNHNNYNSLNSNSSNNSNNRSYNNMSNASNKLSVFLGKNNNNSMNNQNNQQHNNSFVMNRSLNNSYQDTNKNNNQMLNPTNSSNNMYQNNTPQSYQQQQQQTKNYIIKNRRPLTQLPFSNSNAISVVQ